MLPDHAIPSSATRGAISVGSVQTGLVSPTLALETEVPVEGSPRPRVGGPRGYRLVAFVALIVCGLFAAHVWYQRGTRPGVGQCRSGCALRRGESCGQFRRRHGERAEGRASSSRRRAPNTQPASACNMRSSGGGQEQSGIGTADGSIPGSIPIGAHGIRVAEPALPSSPGKSCSPRPIAPVPQPSCVEQLQRSANGRSTTWLVVTVTAHRPGGWSVTHITVRYRSWLRTRTATSGYVVTGRASAPS